LTHNKLFLCAEVASCVTIVSSLVTQ